MFNLPVLVKTEIDRLCRQGQMFTVYDITRILSNKYPGIGCPRHEDVREWVRYYFANSGFPTGWTNDIGDHLPYSPAPHIYAPPKADIRNYDPNALDPKLTLNAVTPAKSRKVKVVAVPVETVKMYAAVYKPTGNRIRPGCSANSFGLYKTRNGPSQLIACQPKIVRKDYEIVQYEVLLTPVGS